MRRTLHTWVICETPHKIEQCEVCLIVKATAQGISQATGKTGVRTEYSYPDGTVIAVDPKPIPACIGE